MPDRINSNVGTIKNKPFRFAKRRTVQTCLNTRQFCLKSRLRKGVLRVFHATKRALSRKRVENPFSHNIIVDVLSILPAVGRVEVGRVAHVAYNGDAAVKSQREIFSSYTKNVGRDRRTRLVATEIGTIDWRTCCSRSAIVN